jgi:hypothetical protein|tara:strand:- start:2529 stop:2933 length:405 start_codon:yes stop_codon:yes gene_type:complete
MAFSTGRLLDVTLDNSGGTPVDLSGYAEGVSMEEEGEALETTKSGDTARTYIVGLENNTFSVEWIVDPTLSAHINGIINYLGTAVIGPSGDASGQDKYTCEAICLNYRQKGTVGGVVKATSDFQVSGVVTRSTY